MRELLGRAAKGNAWRFLYLCRVDVKLLRKISQPPALPRGDRAIAAFARRGLRPGPAGSSRSPTVRFFHP
jgi:hypothetical protein